MRRSENIQLIACHKIALRCFGAHRASWSVSRFNEFLINARCFLSAMNRSIMVKEKHVNLAETLPVQTHAGKGP
jgi:hypothetical protein